MIGGGPIEETLRAPHVIEVLRDPHITDTQPLYFLFRRSFDSERRFETAAAIDVGYHAASKRALTRRVNSALGLA
jgi:hypothetical protein